MSFLDACDAAIWPSPGGTRGHTRKTIKTLHTYISYNNNNNNNKASPMHAAAATKVDPNQSAIARLDDLQLSKRHSSTSEHVNESPFLATLAAKMGRTSSSVGDGRAIPEDQSSSREKALSEQ